MNKKVFADTTDFLLRNTHILLTGQIIIKVFLVFLNLIVKSD